MFPRCTTFTSPLLILLLLLPAGPAAADAGGESEAASVLRWLGESTDDGELECGAACAGALASVIRGTRYAARLSSPAGIVDALSSSGATLERRPVRGQITSPFGVRQDPIRRRRRKHHNGLDFEATRGTLVRAAGPGTITSARRAGGYGRVIYVDHGDGLETRYAHLQKIKVREGEFVPAGAIIGTVGSSGRATGPHLHFEVRVDGRPVAPSEFLSLDERAQRRARPRSML